MFERRSRASVSHYQWAGQQAVEILADALDAAGRTLEEVRSCLDFGCGHGRVLRMLVQRLPAARITACDIDPEAVDFCASEFGAVPLLSNLDLAVVPLETYDLIWMGSVLTHVNRTTALSILTSLTSHLSADGVLAFTTLGDASERRLAALGPALPDRRAEIEAGLATEGLAYVPYPHYRTDRYGLTWHRREWVERVLCGELGLTLRFHRPDGWAASQDAWAFSRSESRPTTTTPV
jgi:SAM-dependent methyltransferase